MVLSQIALLTLSLALERSGTYTVTAADGTVALTITQLTIGYTQAWSIDWGIGTGVQRCPSLVEALFQVPDDHLTALAAALGA